MHNFSYNNICSPDTNGVVMRNNLSNDIRTLIASRFDASIAIDFLNNATQGDCYIFGGTIRRAFTGQGLSGDIDIMMPNGDSRATRALDEIDVPYKLNTQGHRRYRWNKLEIDILHPDSFFTGHDNVESALRAFDLEINALAFHIKSGVIIDPFGITNFSTLNNPRINWSCWENASTYQTAVLAIRLVKTMHENPNIFLPSLDRLRIIQEVIPVIEANAWAPVIERFPLGKDVFIHLLKDTIGRTNKLHQV